MLYDADSEELPAPIALLSAKFASETGLVGGGTKMSWLKGGFKGFVERYGDLVEVGCMCSSGAGAYAGNFADAGINLKLGFGAEGKHGMASMLESPGAMTRGGQRYTQPESPSGFMDHVKVIQCSAGAMIAGTTSLRTPPVGTPPFLKELIDSNDTKGELKNKWHLLEKDEMRRLEMAWQARCNDDPFCVSVGLEANGKNRYTNVWPCRCS